MAAASIEDFRATLRLTRSPAGIGDRIIFSYWNNETVTYSACDTEEVLHIARHRDGAFHLQIANLAHTGTLGELEEILYRWALDEGWLD